jgi:hypothetical protein
LEEFKVEAVDEKLGRQLKLAASCNKNEQLDAKRNAELWTNWTKAFEGTIRRGRNRSIKAELVTYDDGDGGDDDHDDDDDDDDFDDDDNSLDSSSELVKILYCRSSDNEMLFWATFHMSLSIWLPWSLGPAELQDDRRSFFDRLLWYLRLFCLTCCVLCCCLLTEYIYKSTVNDGKIQDLKCSLILNRKMSL